MTPMKPDDLDRLRRRLADDILGLCRYYLPNGRRSGSYWVIGDVHNSPGRSMFVRLHPGGSGGKAGRWTDAATGEHGDPLDLIAATLGLTAFADTLAEAERFLGVRPLSGRDRFHSATPRLSSRTRQACRLYDRSMDIAGTLGEQYLCGRGIDPGAARGLRFLPDCYCRPVQAFGLDRRPALIAPVTDLSAKLTAVHRVYLDPKTLGTNGMGKAAIDQPKRSLGRVHRHAVRFGPDSDVLLIGEGFETVLSVRTLFPKLTAHAALTAGNLATVDFPLAVRRLFIAGDNDPAGRHAVHVLSARAHAAGLSALALWPVTSDFNADLRCLGASRCLDHLLSQIGPADRGAFAIRQTGQVPDLSNDFGRRDGWAHRPEGG